MSGKGNTMYYWKHMSQRKYGGSERKYSNICFNICLLVLACIFSIFYARYATYSETRSKGDIQLHTLVAKALLFQDVEFNPAFFPKHAYTYPVYHFIQKMIHLVLCIDYETAAAIVLTSSIIVSVLLYRKLARMIVADTIRNKYYADLFSIGAVLFETARCPLNDWRYYQVQCAANPFHNPTILFVRPLAIASYIFFAKYVKTYKVERDYKCIIFFSITTFISIGAKPSYAIVFLPAMGIYTLIYMIHEKEVWFGVKAFIAVLPSLLLLIIQQRWMSLNTEAINIHIEFGFFMKYSQFDTQQRLIWAVFAASLVTFPVVILLFRLKLIKEDAFYAISILALIIGWLQMFFLKAGTTGDFSWGYDLAVQFTTLISLAETRKGEKSGKIRTCIDYLAYAIFAYQVVTGILYIWKIYTTDAFWI